MSPFPTVVYKAPVNYTVVWKKQGKVEGIVAMRNTLHCDPVGWYGAADKAISVLLNFITTLAGEVRAMP